MYNLPLKTVVVLSLSSRWQILFTQILSHPKITEKAPENLLSTKVSTHQKRHDMLDSRAAKVSYLTYQFITNQSQKATTTQTT
jgi:hypothetical protein